MHARRKAPPFNGDYVRISLSIPRVLFAWFEKETHKAQHSGNRSSLVRSLIIDAMEREESRR